MYYGVNGYLTDAMNNLSSAISSAGAYYADATEKVTQMAKDINAQNVAYLKETGEKAQALLAPFQQLGMQGGQQLLNVLGANGAEAQTEAIKTMIQAGNMDQQNLQTLSSLYGSSPGTNPFMQVMNQLTGSTNAGQAASDIMNMDPTAYANQLTQAGVANAEDATNAYRNNSFVQQSLDAMNSLGARAVNNSAAAKGMLNSGRTMADLYNQGQAIAGQTLIPAMSSIYGNVLGSTTQSGNAALGAKSSLANQIIGSGTQLAGQLADSMMASNTNMAGNILQNSTSGLSNMFNTGQQAAGNSAQVLGNLGAAVAGENSRMGETVSNATMAAAQMRGQTAIQGAQLGVQMAQMMRPSGMW